MVQYHKWRTSILMTLFANCNSPAMVSPSKAYCLHSNNPQIIFDFIMLSTYTGASKIFHVFIFLTIILFNNFAVLGKLYQIYCSCIRKVKSLSLKIACLANKVAALTAHPSIHRSIYSVVTI